MLASQINTRYAPLGWTIAGAVISGGGRNLFDSAAGDAGDEAIEEEVIGDRHRDAGERRAGHDLAPEDVAANEIGRNAERDRLLTDSSAFIAPVAVLVIMSQMMKSLLISSVAGQADPG